MPPRDAGLQTMSERPKNRMMNLSSRLRDGKPAGEKHVLIGGVDLVIRKKKLWAAYRALDDWTALGPLNVPKAQNTGRSLRDVHISFLTGIGNRDWSRTRKSYEFFSRIRMVRVPGEESMAHAATSRDPCRRLSNRCCRIRHVRS